jgi:hypothetical protein
VGAIAAQQLKGFAQVAVDRAGTDAESAGQIGVGLALAQVCHGQQGLLAGVQASPSGPQLGAMGAQQVGEHDQRAIGHGHPRGVGQHPEAPGLDVLI